MLNAKATLRKVAAWRPPWWLAAFVALVLAISLVEEIVAGPASFGDWFSLVGNVVLLAGFGWYCADVYGAPDPAP